MSLGWTTVFGKTKDIYIYIFPYISWSLRNVFFGIFFGDLEWFGGYVCLKNLGCWSIFYNFFKIIFVEGFVYKNLVVFDPHCFDNNWKSTHVGLRSIEIAVLRLTSNTVSRFPVSAPRAFRRRWKSQATHGGESNLKAFHIRSAAFATPVLSICICVFGLKNVFFCDSHRTTLYFILDCFLCWNMCWKSMKTAWANLNPKTPAPIFDINRSAESWDIGS